jgi:ribosomal protein S24E
MKLVKELKNDLLKRKEMLFVMESESNPGFDEAKRQVAHIAKSVEENIVVKYIKNNFGTKEFFIEAFIYDSKEQKDRTEPKPKAKKQVGS